MLYNLYIYSTYCPSQRLWEASDFELFAPSFAARLSDGPAPSGIGWKNWFLLAVSLLFYACGQWRGMISPAAAFCCVGAALPVFLHPKSGPNLPAETGRANAEGLYDEAHRNIEIIQVPVLLSRRFWPWSFEVYVYVR